MAVSPLGATSTTGAAAAGAASASSSTMNKDAFLKLLVAQLQHQDPLNPTQGTEFVTQLSQFALVEQAVAQSQQLGVLGTQLTGLSNEGVTSLVGKTVTVKGSAAHFDGVTSVSSGATLGGAAASVSVDVVDASGKTVKTLDLGAHAAGAMSIRWDGRDASGNLAPAGTYSFKVKATAADGTSVSADQQVTGTVSGVSYDLGYPLLTLDSGVTAPISDLVGVSSPPATPTK
jgi:flagellar basal-body rod modification protein FlgD